MVWLLSITGCVISEECAVFDKSRSTDRKRTQQHVMSLHFDLVDVSSVMSVVKHLDWPMLYSFENNIFWCHSAQ